jgi:hypothetical protein
VAIGEFSFDGALLGEMKNVILSIFFVQGNLDSFKEKIISVFSLRSF